MLSDIVLRQFAQAVRLRTLRAYRNRDWRQIPIEDNGESLVRIHDIVIRPNIPEEFRTTFPYYFRELHITDDERLFARKTVVVEIFSRAQKIMKGFGYYLVVYAAWHPVEVQEQLFWLYMKKFTIKKFGLESEFSDAHTIEEVKNVYNSLPETMRVTLLRESRSYVSPPSRDLAVPSPHTTGGVLNVWPYHEDHALDLGVPYNWMNEEAGAFHHLKRSRKRFVGNDKLICRNRNMLIYAMTRAGFSCYGPQIWHFNYGNQMHALVTRQKKAIYGYIEL